MILILFVTLVVTIVFGVPIGIGLSVSAAIFCLLSGTDTVIIVQRMTGGLDSFPLMALPFFVLAGLIMEKAGVTKRLMALANCMVGSIRGGLAAVCVLSGCFFGFISGSGVAGAAAVGSVVMPEMVRKGYDKSFTAMLQASAGVLSAVIPPSIALVVIGIAGEISIGKLLVGAIIPGWMTGMMLMVMAVIISRRRGYRGFDQRQSLGELFTAAKAALLPMLTPVIILGGILSGILTPTEAAVIAVVYALVLGFLYGEITFRVLIEVFKDATRISAAIMFIISLATPFGWIMAGHKVPTLITDLFIGMTSNPLIMMLFINLLLLLLGDFMETITIIIIMTPILMPLTKTLGIDPVHFGVVMGLNLAIGGITPPLGVALMTTCRIIDTRYPPFWRDFWPCFGTMVLSLAIVSLFPATVLWLANLL